jgi:hypothetical protein
MPPLTRISSPMWYFRMLASSLAFPAGFWEKEAELISRLLTGKVHNSLNRYKHAVSTHCMLCP